MNYYYHPLGINYKSYKIKSEKENDKLSIECPENSEVFSMSDGKVVDIVENDGEGGNTLVIKAENTDWNNGDIYFKYLHLQDFKVSKNKQVKKGQLIALSGKTGNTDTSKLGISIKKTIKGQEYPIINKEDFKKEAVQAFWNGEIDGDTELKKGPYLKAIFQQKIIPIYSTSTYKGGVLLSANQDTCHPDYLKYEIISSAMGEEPDIKYGWDDIDSCPALLAAACCIHEYNQSQSMGENSSEYNNSLLYSKLFRCWMMFPNLVDGDCSSLLKTVKNFDKNNNTGKEDGDMLLWAKNNIKITEEFIDYTKKVFNNIKYPMAFGITDKNVETGNSRLYCAAAGIWMNLSDSTFKNFPVFDTLTIKYKYKEPLSNGYVALMYQGYWLQNTIGESDKNILTEFKPPQGGLDGVAAIAQSSEGKTCYELAKDGWDTISCTADWCAQYAMGLIKKTMQSTNSWDENIFKKMSVSVCETIGNFIRDGNNYYAPNNTYTTGLEILQNNKITLSPGDLMFFDFGGDSLNSNYKNNKTFEHIGIIITVNGNQITVAEGNTGGNGWTNNKSSINKYDIDKIEQYSWIKNWLFIKIKK